VVQAIMSAIDDYAERETGNREYFWAAQGGLTNERRVPSREKRGPRAAAA
jgi:hypothetical protein